MLRETGAAARAVLAGSDWRSLQAFRAPPFHLGASRRDIARLYFRWGEPDPACRCFAVPDRFKFLPVPTRRFVRAAHRPRRLSSRVDGRRSRTSPPTVGERGERHGDEPAGCCRPK